MGGSRELGPEKTRRESFCTSIPTETCERGRLLHSTALLSYMNLLRVFPAKNWSAHPLELRAGN